MPKKGCSYINKITLQGTVLLSVTKQRNAMFPIGRYMREESNDEEKHDPHLACEWQIKHPHDGIARHEAVTKIPLITR